MGVIRAIFISSGKIPWAKELLNIYRSGSNLKSKTSVTWKEISSLPGLLLVFIGHHSCPSFGSNV